MKMSSVGLLLVLYCGAVVASGAEEQEVTFVAVKLGQNVKLNCKDAEEPSWKRMANESEGFQNIEYGEDFESSGSRLIIKSMSADDVGEYKCYDDDDQELMTFSVDTAVRVSNLKKSYSVDEGSSTEEDLQCKLLVHHDAIFKWYRRPLDSEPEEMQQICGTENDNCPMEEGSAAAAEALFDNKEKAPAKPFKERISIEVSEDGTKSTLIIKDTVMEDRMIYTCRAIERLELDRKIEDCKKETFCDETETIVRVKDPLAALWPFLGIVAEVVLLCLIIFFCERRRKDEKEDMEDEGYNGNNVTSNSNLRQRK